MRGQRSVIRSSTRNSTSHGRVVGEHLTKQGKKGRRHGHLTARPGMPQKTTRLQRLETRRPRRGPV